MQKRQFANLKRLAERDAAHTDETEEPPCKAQ
jgi:hypothetical protein